MNLLIYRYKLILTLQYAFHPLKLQLSLLRNLTQ